MKARSASAAPRAHASSRGPVRPAPVTEAPAAAARPAVHTETDVAPTAPAAEHEAGRGAPRPPVQVQIFGDAYTLRGDADPAYVLELAAYVDARMREVTDKLPVASAARVAVLASLNLADELFQERARRAREEQRLLLRAGQLGAQLDQVLRDGEPS